jgi:hypothetical protein
MNVSLNTMSLKPYRIEKTVNAMKDTIREIKFNRLRNTNKIDDGNE